MNPVRMCGGCMKRTCKSELLRVVRTSSGTICVDVNQKIDGRGVYICKSEKCLDNAIKRKWLSRGLKCEIEPEIFDKLREFVNSGE